MRIARLDLTRYGKFTDRSLDFGAARPGQPDLHILYGPNEAGKSTTLSGWLDLLYGIPVQSRFGFLHPYATMRIGAALELPGGQRLELARSKGRHNTLTDASGAALPEAVVQAALGGIDRAGYEAMFSLDDDTLEAGGEGILASQGDLGQLLFSASAGLADLGARLEALRRGAEVFHRPGARKGRLADLKAQLEAIEAQRRSIDTQAADHARLTEAEAQAEAEWRAVQAEQAGAAARAEALRRDLAVLPVLARMRQVEADLLALGPVPMPPPGWAEALPDLAHDEAATVARLEETEAAIVAVEAELAGLCPDPAVLALAPQIAAVAALKSAHDEAAKDLPNRRAEAAEAVQIVAGLMARLGRSGGAPRAVLLDAATTGRLRGLIAARSGIEARVRAARTEAAAAADRQAGAAARLAAAGGVVETGPLAELVARLRARDPDQALRQARRQLAQAEAALAPRLAALLPWRGSAVDLAVMVPPAPRVPDQMAAGQEAARRALAEAEAQQARASADAARHGAVLAARQTAGRITPDVAAAARALRERAWAAHRQALTEPTAEAFEAALRADDQITAQQAAAGAEAQLAAQAREAQALARLDQAAAEAAATEARAELARLDAELARIVGSLSPALGAAVQTPADLRDWLALRNAALEAQAGVAAAQADCAAAERDATEARIALAGTLAAAGAVPTAKAGLEALMAQAQALCDAGVRLAALREAAAEASRAAARRAEERQQADAADSVWQADWAAVCAGCWLGEGPLPDVAAMEAILTTLEALDRAVTSAEALADRIAKMEANHAAFATGMTDLSGALGLPETAPWPEITARLQRAEAIEAARAKAGAALNAARGKAQALRAQAGRLAAQIEDMAGFFGVTGLGPLRVCLEEARRRQALEAVRAAAQAEMTEAFGADLPAALDRLPVADRAALEADLARMTAEAAQHAQAAQQAFAALSEARRQLGAVGGDDAVARLEVARQTVLLETAEEARAHLRQRFGILALDHALRAYRDGHRSAMLRRASQAFATISRGAYTGLAAQPDRDREVLVALARDGTSKLAADLSKGTRFQLYLALRVAGYHELAQTRAPVPFIADDIMETFDDDRSAEAFSLLAGMAEVGQVIYLTHHRHLCEIARTVCPAARLYHL